MTPKEYLSQPFYLTKEIRRKRDQMVRWHEMATKATSTTTAIMVSGTMDHSKIEKACAEREGLANDITVLSEKLKEAKANVRQSIAEVDYLIYRQVLYYRYIRFMPWGKIAEKLCDDAIAYATKHLNIFSTTP